MFIPMTSLLLVFFILIVPFVVILFIIKRMTKKEKESENNSLELRVQILEEEIENLKKHIEFLDEL